MPALYQAADALLLPTRYDPFANVTLEAAAAGLAIITSAGNGAAEWLGEAIQVMNEDAGPAEYAKAMKSLRNERNEAFAWGRSCSACETIRLAPSCRGAA